MALHLSGRMNKPAGCVQRTSKPQRLQPVCATPGGFFTGKSGRAGPQEDVMSRDLAPLLINNREWSKRQQEKDPGYFERLSNQQAPEYLWLGCADSRVPANVVIGLEPGEVFVQRNVGNQALHTDMNCMACIEFSVKSLKVKSIIVCGHYNCGAVKASLRWPASQPGLTNMWISDIREARNQHIAELYELEPDRQVERLCEINVMRQVFHVCTSSAVQEAWKDGQPLSVYGVIYSLKDGILTELVGPLTGNNDIDMDQAKFEDRAPGGPIKLSGSANPLDTRAMAEKLALHNTFV